MRKIVHVDADSFYASIEMRDDPRLRYLPIAVTVGKRPIDNFSVGKGDSTKGLLPLANGLSIDLVARSYTVGGMVASWWQPLASAIVNGLAVSTILTLLLTPAMLLLPEIISKRLGFRVADHQFEDDAVE